jgi:hypothetical protein
VAVQLECISRALKTTLGGDELRSDAWQTYTWTARLQPNICGVRVRLYLRNHKADGDTPHAQWVSVVLSATPATGTADLPITVSVLNSERGATPTRSSTPATTETASLTVEGTTPTLTMSPEASYTAATTTQSPTVDHSASATVYETTSLTATSSVTTTEALSESLGPLSVSRTQTQTASSDVTRSSSELTITASATIDGSKTLYGLPTASRSKSHNTAAVSPSESLPLPPTVTPSYLPSTTPTDVPQPPITQAPVTVAAAVSLVTVTSTALLFAASAAAGSASMQAVISNAACGMGNGTIKPADSPAMYFVSPFVGDSFAIVGGNIGLVLAALCVHVAALAAARSSARFKNDPRGASTLVRYPTSHLCSPA